jgi:transcriptional regulator with XRE-family HTH domain
MKRVKNPSLAPKNKEVFKKRFKELKKHSDKDKLKLKLNVGDSTFKQWEKPDNNFPSVEHLILLSEFFGVSTDFLLGLSEVKSPKADLIAIAKITGLSEDAVIELSSMPVVKNCSEKNLTDEEKQKSRNERTNAMRRQAETMRHRKIIDLLLTNVRGKKALEALAHYYYATPFDSKKATSFKLKWNLPNNGGTYIDTPTLNDEAFQDALLQIAINALKQIKTDKESADFVNNRVEMLEAEKGKPLTEKEKQKVWEDLALLKTRIPIYKYERDIIYKEGSDNGKTK